MEPEQRSRRSTLVWVGGILGALSIAGTLSVVAIAGSIPQRAPTARDYGLSFLCFGILAIVMLLSMAGAACSIVGLVIAKKHGAPVLSAVVALTANLAPWVIGFAGDALGWWTS
jgi:hypothetical protein